MLKRFEVCNYKTFKDKLVLDFSNVGGYRFNTDCIYDGLLSKIILYGRNATGKTSLGKAFQDLFIETVAGRNSFIEHNGLITNADSNIDVACFEYEFSFGDDVLVYYYEKDRSNELQKEIMKINDSVVINLDFNKGQFDTLDLEKLNLEGLQVERYLETIVSNKSDITVEERHNMSFLRFIINNAALSPSSIVNKLSDYILRMRFNSSNSMHISPITLDKFTDLLSTGEELEKFENYLNEMGIECRLRLKNLPDGQKELYFDHTTLVPFYDNASSGTRKLTDMYMRFFLNLKKASLIFMDEFDAYFHYEMAEKVVLFLKKNYPASQVILTTHNTNLMTNHIMRPDCLMILSRDGRITPLCAATERELREGHNLEKMYIAGEFERYE